MPNVYKNSLGIKLEITLNTNLTGNTGVSYLVKKPTGVNVTWVATVDNAITGITSYLSIADDLNETGKYHIQPKVTFAGYVQVKT